MEKRSKPIGEILSGLGRITPADVERALAHQRERGGYFGDALVELGLLSTDEVKFAFADQYDIPFVHLRPESIDRSVAQLVPADWAREHQMLPVLRDGDTVTVILTMPPTPAELEAVRRFTRAERLEAAVSNAETIDSLIEAVHGEPPGVRVSIGEWITQALAVGAAEVGISVRRDQVSGWYRADGTVRCTIGGKWPVDLRQLVSPFPEARHPGVRRWPAILSSQGRMWRVDCSALESAGAVEWVARIGAAIPADPASPVATPDLRAAVLNALRDGEVCVRACREIDGVAEGVVEAMLPALPGALLGPGHRSVHLADRPIAVPPGVLCVRPNGPVADVLLSLQPFALDALTLDVEGLAPDDLTAARRAARLVIFRDLTALPEPLQADFVVCLKGENALLWTLNA